MMTKSLYATSLYLLITGLTSVNGLTSSSGVVIQNSFFGEICMFVPVGNVAFGSPVTMSACDSEDVTNWDISGNIVHEIGLSGTNFCMDSTAGVDVRPCRGSEEQQWLFNNNGQIKVGSSIVTDPDLGQCVAVDSHGIALQFVPCNDTSGDDTMFDQKQIWIA